MALALYRKYRPATFAEVVGQEHVTVPLRTALAAGRVNHAYLFSGPRGCGKTSSARILARSLNCEQGPTDEPCGTCDSCVGLAPNGPGTVDVVELDAASHGGVDDARELRDRAFFAPAQSRYRVFIVDEAHMVTTQGFNALLKIVEEPPEHLVFIFATTEPDKVLPTIRSRTHHYPFRLIPPGAMRDLLERNCAAEKATVEPAVFPLVIRAGGGSARDTQSVMDQLLAGAGPEGVTYERAVALLGVTDVALIDDMVDGLAADDASAVYGTVDKLVEAGHDPRRFAADLLDRLRDLVLLRAVPDAGARGLVNAPADELERMTGQAQRLGPGTLTRYAEIVHTGLVEMRGATAPRLVLELLCARMLLPAAAAVDPDVDSPVLQRVEQLERRMESGQVAQARPARDGEPARRQPAQDARSNFTRPSQRAADTASPGAAPEPAARQAEPAARSTEPTVGATEPAARPTEPAARFTETAPRSTEPAARQAEPAGRSAGSAAAAAQPAARQAEPAARSTEPVERSAEAAARAAEPARPEPAPSGGPGEPAAQEAPAEPAPTGAMDAAGMRRVWPEVLAAMRDLSRSTQAMLTNGGTVQAVEGTTVVVSHTAAPLARRLAEPRNTEVIAQALSAVLGGSWQVRCVQGDGVAEPAPAAPERPPAPARRYEPPQRVARPVVEDVPPEPDLPPEPPEDEEELMAQAARGPGEDVGRQDPEAVMLKLLADKLGARPVEG